MNKTDSTRPCKQCGTANRNNSGNCRFCAKASQTAWLAKNSERARELNRAWGERNPEKIKAKNLASYSANKEKRIAYAAAYKARNYAKISEYLSEYRKKNKDAANASSALWRKENPLRRKIHHQNRRSLTIAGGERLSKGLVEKLLILQRGKCVCCGCDLDGKYHLDHIVPLALGGKNRDENMQLLLPLCNMQKHAKHPVDFMQSRGFLL